MDNKLGEFIRAHREHTQPEDVGLPGGGRRRTPGLRREELAQLCSVSPTWLTWLEQGRPVSASAKMLGNISDVMRLSPAERAYLFRLADKVDSRTETTSAEPTKELTKVVKAIKTPAYILNRQWDAVAWNRPAKELFVGWLDLAPVDVAPNLLRFMFTANNAPKLIIDWSERADRLVAEFRADCGKHADQGKLKALVDELTTGSKEFRKRWNQQNVVNREGGERRFVHPKNGELVFDQITLHLAAQTDLKLVMLLPVV